MGKNCCSVTFAILGVLLVGLGCLVLFFFDPYVDSKIQEELILKEGTPAFERWAEPPVVPYLKIFFFNMTNVEQYLSKTEKPKLVEIGPYSYSEKWFRSNATVNDNGTISYTFVKYYYFDRESSVGPESDIIHTLNIPVVVAVDRVKNLNKFVKLTVSSMLQVLNETAFIKRNVSDLIWGYADPLLELGNRFFPPDQQVPYKKFGYFYERNGTASKIFNVYSGVNGIQNFTLIASYGYETHLKFWKTDACNMINGTDGSSYPPGSTVDTTLYLFNEQLCRSLPLKFEKEVEHSGVPGFRYTPPDNVFGSVSENKENECFCIDGPPCAGSGLFNISACQFNVPSFLSWPHFYQADQRFRDAVTGMTPNKTKHQLYIDIAPRTGFPLSAQARIQINFLTTGVPEIKPVKDVSTLIMPVIWFEDGVKTMPEEVVELLRMSSSVPEVAKRSLLLASFITGGIMFILAILLLLKQKNDSTAKLPISLQNNGHTNPMVSSHYPDK